MKHFFKAVALCFLLLLGLIIFGKSRPATFEVSQSLNVAGSLDHVFEVIDNPRDMTLWAPYLAGRAVDETVVTGAENGVGALIHWRSADAPFSVGEKEILAITPPYFIQSRFYSQPYDGVMIYGLSEDVSQSNVVTTVQLNIKTGGFPYFDRVRLWLATKKIEAEFASSLSRLKTLAEASN